MIHTTFPFAVDQQRIATSHHNHTNINASDLGISPEEFESLRQAFRIFDSSGTGAIPIDQFSVILKSLHLLPASFIKSHQDITDQMARLIDLNHDHTIDFAEFAEAMVNLDAAAAVAVDHRSSRDADSELHACFQYFDKNGDGLISQEELQEDMDRLGEHLSPQDIKAMMDEADTNGDGYIDFEEFKQLSPPPSSHKLQELECFFH